MGDGDFGVAVLTFRSRHHLTAKLLRDEVQAVADAEHGQPEAKHSFIGRRSVPIVDRRWPAAQNNSRWFVALDLSKRGGTGQNGGKDLQLADAARNQLRVLRTEVENDDGLGFHE